MVNATVRVLITSLRRWIARVIAFAVLLLTLGRVSVEWEGVAPARESEERGAITATVDDDEP